MRHSCSELKHYNCTSIKLEINLGWLTYSVMCTSGRVREGEGENAHIRVVGVFGERVKDSGLVQLSMCQQ